MKTTMPSKSFALLVVVLMLFSVVTQAYRLDGYSQLSETDQTNEVDDPYLIHRLQALLAAAAVSKRASGIKDVSTGDHTLSHRLTVNRRPGLIRLKKNT